MGSKKVINYLFFFFTYNFLKLNIFSPNKNFAKVNLSNLPAVPADFITILEITLQKLVSLNLLDKKFTGSDFLSKMRVKFSNASKKVYLLN